MSVNLSVVRGTKTVYQCTATEGGAAVNLTGAVIYYEARQYPPGKEVITTAGAIMIKSSTDDISITTPASGIFLITFDKADTNTLDVGTYPHAFEWLPSGETETRNLDSGFLSIEQDFVRGT